MNKKRNLWAGIMAGMILFRLLPFAWAVSEPPASGEVAAHTAGEISAASDIRVRFVDEIAGSDLLNKPLFPSPFSFTPEIKGSAVWTDKRTIIFKPLNHLPPGLEYKAFLRLSDFVDGAGDFPFSFSVIRQSFDIQIDGLKSMTAKDPEKMELTGKITTADKAPRLGIMGTISAEQDGKSMNIRWTHDQDGLAHRFSAGPVLRRNAESRVVLRWKGMEIGVEKSGEKRFVVPPSGPFQVMEARAVHQKTRHIEIRFTDPLSVDQDLSGIVRVSDGSALRFDIDKNLLMVYGAEKWTGKLTVNIETGVKNAWGQRLDSPGVFTLSFEEIKPQVRFVGKKVIIPTTQGLTLPIETVNLRSIRVRVIKVREKNIPQFLQVNTLDEDKELHRVGREVWQKTVDTGYDPGMKNTWVRYGLDLSRLIENSTMGLHRIEIDFQRRDIVYDCPESSESFAQKGKDKGNVDTQIEQSYWDNYAEDQSNWYEGYEQRKNPCHPGYYRSYYNHDIKVSRNVLVSDIGLIAKKGETDELFIAAVDVKTAKPLPDVIIKVLNYQQEEMARGRTDADGILKISMGGVPYLVLGEKDGQPAYLRLDNGSALSVSHFDVSGGKVEKGLKGFLYGERGVWRPGDDIFTTFILLDEAGTIPEDHPVIFELADPRGRLVDAEKKTKSVNGFYAFATATGADAPTGNWTARVRVGGVTFSKTIKVETVIPNRLRIGFDFGPEIRYLSGEKTIADLSAAWLHGAIARDLKADVRVKLNSAPTMFPEYNEYRFDDPVQTYRPEEKTVFEGKLDSEGKTIVKMDIRAGKSSPGMLAADFTTRVFEPGGAFSIDRFRMPYHPYEQYVGIRTPKGDVSRGMLLTDTEHPVSFVLVDKDGKKIPEGRLSVEMYKIKWRWWWEKGTERLAGYVGSKSYKPIKKGTVEIRDGEGVWPFEIKYPEWGRYLIRAKDEKGGHYTGRILYIDWPGWAGRAQRDDPGGAAVLSFSADKEGYKVNEKITLTIPTGKAGRGLVSIETGSRVLRTEWIEGLGKEVRYSFTATPEMAPNVYAHVTFLQPHLKAGNDLPIRMYGVIPIEVGDPATVLKPVLGLPETFQPESTAQIRVSEASGKKMTYTLAVVDEGLLDLTRFATPDPWNHFYKREALGVRTWDLFDMVAGAYGGTLESLLAIGGDGEGGEKGGKKANRFPPMVLFMGPFELAENMTESHEIKIPRYVGSVRVMVVAGQGRAFGSTGKAVPVRKPLMILGTLPRVLGPGEELELPVSVFAMEDSVKNVSVSLETKGPLTIVDSARKSIMFSRPGDDIVRFRLKVGDAVGVAGVIVSARSNGESATHEMEIDVRMPGFPVTDVVDAAIGAGETWETRLGFPGVSGTNSGTLEVSRTPPLNLEKRLSYLIRYPHGCLEQTVSAVFPQIYLDRLITLSDERKQSIQENVRAGIEKIASFQTPGGGFAYWPGREGHEWTSSYAGHFLVEARKAGYHVPGSLIDSWKRFQKEKAGFDSPGAEKKDLIQAYRLYTLALAGDPELGAMNRMRESKKVSPEAAWRLAAAYMLAGHPEAASALIPGVEIKSEEYRELDNTFGSTLRDMAMILESLCLMEKLTEAVPLVRDIAERLGSEKWLSTQETAYALVALARYSKGSVKKENRKLEFSISRNGAAFDKVSDDAFLVQIPMPEENQSENESVAVRNTGKAPLYARLITSGVPMPGSETAAENGMEIRIRYLDEKGKEIKPEKLEQGSDLIVESTVVNTGRHLALKEVAFSQLFPSGWEIHNERMGGTETKDEFSFRDIRDDRIYTYFDIPARSSKVFKVRVHAAYTGRFYFPMAAAEAMYDATINGRQPGMWVEVVRPGAD